MSKSGHSMDVPDRIWEEGRRQSGGGGNRMVAAYLRSALVEILTARRAAEPPEPPPPPRKLGRFELIEPPAGTDTGTIIHAQPKPRMDCTFCRQNYQVGQLIRVRRHENPCPWPFDHDCDPGEKDYIHAEHFPVKKDNHDVR
jgi:hypothetical protein